ncbi:hypothetical protein MP228_008949 [Amoeboaphelidium protococcarum]|nr:hypothetical protein MP228_008949 [Amoeboaphelidium protococcarum]
MRFCASYWNLMPLLTVVSAMINNDRDVNPSRVYNSAYQKSSTSLFKRQSDAQSFNIMKSNDAYMNLTGSSEDQLIYFDLVCNLNDTDASSCNKLAVSMKSVCGMITSTIALSQKLKIKIVIYNMCSAGDKQNCAELVTLADASPSQYYILTGDDLPTAAYPQSLARQLRPNEVKGNVTKEYDINVRVNTNNISWHFGVDGDNIGPEQQDFENAVLHELLHGLGFTSFIVPSIADPNAVTSTQAVSGLQYTIFDYFVAQITSELNKTVANKSVEVVQWIDVDKDKPLNERLQKLKQLGTQSIKTVFNYPTQGSALKNAKSLPKSVKFDPSIILLNSPPLWTSGSSISHFIPQYGQTQDFLISPTLYKNVTLKWRMAQLNMTKSPFGPRIKIILQSMGYKLVDAQANMVKQQSMESSGKASTLTMNCSSLLVAAIAGSLVLLI